MAWVGAAGLVIAALGGCARPPGGAGLATGDLEAADRSLGESVRAKVSGSVCELGAKPGSNQGFTKLHAETPILLSACLGFVHARDRGWQMDHLRRIAQGRQAEVYGWASFRSDFGMRVLGLYEKAQGLYGGLSTEAKENAWAYAHGVNQAWQEGGGAGFKDFGYRPESWHPLDTIGVLLLQSFDQTKRSFELDLAMRGSPPVRPPVSTGAPWDISIIRESELPKKPHASLEVSRPSLEGPSNARPQALLQQYPRGVKALPETQGGSNNWVVAPKLSASGAPILANDPHLALKTPVFWKWVKMTGPALNIEGVTLPGVPLVIAGTNGRVAWGLTNSYLDVADVSESEGLGESTQIRPLIWFKWWRLKIPFFYKAFARTQEGWPVLPLPGQTPKVLRWSGYDLEPKHLEALLSGALMRVADARELDGILAGVGLPSWNYVYADQSGTIGYRATGLVPKRAGGSATLGVYPSVEKLRGWNYLSADEMPHLFAPSRGYIVTANHRSWPEDAPWDSGLAQAEGFRAARIEELIQATRKHTLESTRRIQCDLEVGDARHLRDLLVKALPKAGLEPKLQPILEGVAAWDLKASLDCKACGVFRSWMDGLRTRGFAPRDLYQILKTGQLPADASLKIGDVRGEIYLAFVSATREWGRGWQAVHRAYFPHLSGVMPTKQSAEGIGTPGDYGSVNVGEGRWTEHGGVRVFEHQYGASMRMVVELTRPVKVSYSLADPEDPVALEEWLGCRLGSVSGAIAQTEKIRFSSGERN